MFTFNEERESVKVLRECIDLQIRKSSDYQNPNSSVVQAMHYRRGIDTIHDMLHQKMLRALSLIEAAKSSPSYVAPNFESLEDTYKDVVNYASFAVSYLRGKMEGQDPMHDIFNQKKPAPPAPAIMPSDWDTYAQTTTTQLSDWAPPTDVIER